MTSSDLRRSLKRYSRQTIGMNPMIALRASAAVVAITLVLVTVQSFLGHPLTYMILPIEGNEALYTGLQITSSGIAGALRLDAAGAIMAIQMTWGYAAAFLVENLVILLVSVPVTYAAFEHFIGLLQRQVYSTKSLFRWYTDLRLIFPSFFLELIVSAVRWGARMICLAPGLSLLATGAAGEGDSMLLNLSSLLMIAGLLISYGFSCQLEPARYFLANQPELGTFGALRAGWRSLKGRRLEFFWFSLSFIGWDFFSAFTSGLGDIYTLPYKALTTVLYLGIVTPEKPPEGGGIAPRV